MFVVEGTIPATVTPGTDSDRFCFDFVFDFDFENRPSFSGWLNFFFFFGKFFQIKNQPRRRFRKKLTKVYRL